MKPSIDDVADQFRVYHEKHPTWGSLHIVLDDGNVSDYYVWFCLDYARDTEDMEGEELANILLRMSKTQRLKIGRTL